MLNSRDGKLDHQTDKRQMAILLTDDGSLDTTFICSECKETFRANYVMDTEDADDAPEYNDWIAEVIESLETDHYCEDDN